MSTRSATSKLVKKRDENGDTANVPKHAQTIIVPLANPNTGRALLRLAIALEHPEDGRIIALSVSIDEDAESEKKGREEFQKMFSEFQKQGEPVEFLQVKAPGIARGILDTVREYRADLLILGVRQPSRGEVVIGTVAENVAQVAPCDVLIYRSAHHDEFDRVVVWANGSAPARVAAQIGLTVAESYDTEMSALYVQSHGRSYWQGSARVEQTLQGLKGAHDVSRYVSTAGDLLSGVLSRIDDTDLLVLGFSRTTNLERWLYGDFTRELLNRCEGPVILVSRHTDNTRLQRDYRLWLTWIRPTLTRAEQDEIVRDAHDNASPTLDYHALFLISTLLASLGLLLNSPAVVIGAMLVAPLMQPLMAYSVGMVTGRIPLMRRASVTVMVATLLGLLLTILLGLLLPNSIPTSEMLARGNPSLLDAAVALVSGFAAAYATARRDIPAALAGVAIAAALVPPLATAGLAVAFQDADLAFGAFSLFLMNILYISLAGWAVFFWLGMRPRTEQEQANRRQVSAAFVGLLVVPLFLIFLNLTGTATGTSTIERVLDESFAQDDVISVEYNDSEFPNRVLATLRSRNYPSRSEVRAAQAALREETGNNELELQVIVQRIVSP